MVRLRLAGTVFVAVVTVVVLLTFRGGGAGLNQLGAAGGAQFIRIPTPFK